MSHEIRTPLNAILGFIDVLRLERDAIPPETRDDYLDIVHRSGRHLLGLVNDVLDLSKIEAGHMEYERLPVDVVELVEEVVSIMRAKALEKRIEFTLKYSTALPKRVHTDALRLRQILINLVGNAIKFTARGEVALVVGVNRADNHIRFEIRDTGDGIEPAALEHIFEPFKQADGTVTRRHGGTGLGLTISRKFARRSGGTSPSPADAASAAFSPSTSTWGMSPPNRSWKPTPAAAARRSTAIGRRVVSPEA